MSHIARANMEDGSDPEVLIQDDLIHPNGLAVDTTSKSTFKFIQIRSKLLKILHSSYTYITMCTNGNVVVIQILNRINLNLILRQFLFYL